MLLINALLFAAFFSWAIYAPRLMRLIVEAMLWFLAILITAEVIFGCMILANDEPPLFVAHRWLGHFLVMIVWLLTSVNLALVIRNFRRSRGTAVLFGLVSCTVLAIVLLASFTGYLDPFGPGADVETRNRFVLLHEVVPPVLLAILVPFGIAVARTLPQGARRIESREDPTSLPPPSDNPYAAPRSR
jgi:hypothetical protein